MSDFYVSTTGNDTTGTGTLANPWKTIDKAASTVTTPTTGTSGHTIYIRGGTYNEKVVADYSGSATYGYITYSNYPGETVIIDGTGIALGNVGLFEFSNRDYIWINGLEVRNAWYDGTKHKTAGGGTLYATSSTCGIRSEWTSGTGHGNIKISNCYVHEIQSSGIMMKNWASPYTITNVYVYNNRVGYCCYDANEEMISLQGIRTFDVYGNWVHNCQGIEGQAMSPACDKEGIAVKCIGGGVGVNSGNGSIRDNFCEDCKCGILTGGAIDGTDDSHITVHSNVVYDCLHGIMLDTESASRDCYGYDVYNNLIIGTSTYGYSESAVTGSYNGIKIQSTSAGWVHTVTDVVVMNNSFYGWFGGFLLNGGIGAAGDYEACIVRNNSFYSTQSGVAAFYAADTTNFTIDHNLFYNSEGAWAAGNILGTSYVAEDPDYVDIVSESDSITAGSTTCTFYDLHLQSTSPAIGAGSVTNDFSPDFDDVPRGDINDIGAFQYSEGEGGGEEGGGGTNVVEALQTAASTDDAFQYADGTMYTGYTYLHIASHATQVYYSGARFVPAATIPVGSTVNSATFSMWVAEADYDDISADFHCQDGTGAPVAFSATSGDISNRTRTTAKTTKDADGVIVDAGSWYEVDITTALQEVVDSYSVSAIVVLAIPHTDDTKVFHCKSYDQAPNNLGPKLDIDYDTPATSDYIGKVYAPAKFGGIALASIAKIGGIEFD